MQRRLIAQGSSSCCHLLSQTTYLPPPITAQTKPYSFKTPSSSRAHGQVASTLKIAVTCSRFSTEPCEWWEVGMRSSYSIVMHSLPMLINICSSTCFQWDYSVVAVKAAITVSGWMEFLPWWVKIVGRVSLWNPISVTISDELQTLCTMWHLIWGDTGADNGSHYL